MTPGRPTVRSGLRPPRPTNRVLLWRMDSSDSMGAFTAWFGALEDGTVFQQLRGQRWKTVMGPGSTDKSFALLVEMTRVNEEHMTMTGPVEFSVDERVAQNIRDDVNWNEVNPILMIGFDMALRAAR